MTLNRLVVAGLIAGATLAGAWLAGCSAVDPNPPNPHILPDPLERVIDEMLSDGGAADAEAGP